MDVFQDVVARSGGYLRDAALAGAHELGLFAALKEPLSAPALAARLQLAPRRLRALLDVLVLHGALSRQDAPGGPRFRSTAAPPARPQVAADGWGRLAAVLRSDRPLPDEAQDEEATARFHHMLGQVGAAPAARLAARLAPAFAQGGGLLDGGCGIGTYAAALLHEAPAAQATLVDRPEVLRLAAAALRPLGTRVTYLPGDLRSVPLPAGHRAALLCNLLHLHDEATCALLVQRAAAALAPGGELIVKDLYVDPQRRGPAVGLLFSLNMALYTDGGTVHCARDIQGWLRAAGLAEVRAERDAEDPGGVLVLGRRP